MGAGSSTSSLGKKSTAKNVVDKYSEGNPLYLSGKTAVITGGNSGIGLETAKALASAGCRVIIGSRSVENGRAAVENEMKASGEGGYVVADTNNVVVAQLNLESLSSVASFAEIVAKEARIDYLVLNAGVMAIKTAEYTENGWEKQLATNHFGHFYLTSILLEKIKAQSHPSRIVVVSSVAHTRGSVLPTDLHFKNGRKYSAWDAYGQSKAANILFTKSLADKLSDTPVRALCLHPGVIKTNLQKHLSTFIAGVVNTFITDKNIPQGASTTVYACLNPEFEDKKFDGSYLSDCAVIKTSTQCTDANGQLRAELWKVTEEQIQAALQEGKK
jgi:NAD(P)-dependent dehydrogenase (short-subunit alcohol dehydrogenase family)